MLDKYTHDELVHIVDMYNLNIDMDTLKKKKSELMKEMAKVPKKKLANLPTKKEIKPMVEKDKKKKSSLLNKVKKGKKPVQKNKITNYTK